RAPSSCPTLSLHDALPIFASAMIRVVLADDGAECLDILQVLAEALVAAGAAGLVSHGSLFSVVVCPGRVLALLDLLGRCAQCLSDYRNTGTRCPASSTQACKTREAQADRL